MPYLELPINEVIHYFVFALTQYVSEIHESIIYYLYCYVAFHSINITSLIYPCNVARHYIVQAFHYEQNALNILVQKWYASCRSTHFYEYWIIDCRVIENLQGPGKEERKKKGGRRKGGKEEIKIREERRGGKVGGGRRGRRDGKDRGSKKFSSR